MGRALGAVGWVIAGALIGVIVGVFLGLAVASIVVSVTRPRGGTDEIIGFLAWGGTCLTTVIICGLAGAAGAIVWGCNPERPSYTPRFDADRHAYQDRDD